MIDLDNIVLDHEKTITSREGDEYLLEVGDVFLWGHANEFKVLHLIKSTDGSVDIHYTLGTGRSSLSVATFEDFIQGQDYFRREHD